MHVLVVGAGSIGGFLGGVLSARAPGRSVSSVTLLARGEHLRAMQKQGGIKVVTDAEDATRRGEFFAGAVRLAGTLAEARTADGGPFDVVFLAVKAHQLLDVARDPAWAGVLHAGTILVPLQNGLPWYAFLQLPSSHPLAGRRLNAADPAGELERAFPTAQVVGAIAMPACVMHRPGEVVHEGNWSIPIGTFNQELAKKLVGLMAPAGFKMEPHEDFLQELLVKSLGSAVFNPASALTGATLGQLVDENDPVARTLCEDAMNEVRAVSTAVLLPSGVQLRVTNQQRLRGAARLGFHKTSMLQDVEAGKTDLEIECLVGALVEVAAWRHVPVPVLGTLYRLVKVKQKVMRQQRVQAKL